MWYGPRRPWSSSDLTEPRWAVCSSHTLTHTGERGGRCVLACGLKEKGMEWEFLFLDGLLSARSLPLSLVGESTFCNFILFTNLWARFYPISQLKTIEIKLLAAGQTVRDPVVIIKSHACSSAICTIHICMSLCAHSKYVIDKIHMYVCLYVYMW